jgi:hypothetical protein
MPWKADRYKWKDSIIKERDDKCYFVKISDEFKRD